MSDEKEEPKACDNDSFVIPGPELPDGSGRMCIHHSEDHTIRHGVMKPLEEGKPLPEDAMFIERREDSNVYDVVGSVAEMKKNGPSKVNSPAFKQGWDNIFGKKTVDSTVN